jgi:hypothetical protein
MPRAPATKECGVFHFTPSPLVRGQGSGNITLIPVPSPCEHRAKQRQSPKGTKEKGEQ